MCLKVAKKGVTNMKASRFSLRLDLRQVPG